MGRLIVALLVLDFMVAQATASAFPILEKAYEALRARDYDRAIIAFAQALTLEPTRASIHKDLAYTLLKTGETEAARDHFGEAARLEWRLFRLAPANPSMRIPV